MSSKPKPKLSPQAARLKREMADVIAARLKEIEEDKKRPDRGRGLSRAEVEAIRDGKA